jgi:hypothetical protein
MIVSPIVVIANDRRLTLRLGQVAGRGRSVSPVVVKEEGGLAVSKQVDAANAFQKFAAAPESAALLRKSGMEPWHGGR